MHRKIACGSCPGADDWPLQWQVQPEAWPPPTAPQQWWWRSCHVEPRRCMPPLCRWLLRAANKQRPLQMCRPFPRSLIPTSLRRALCFASHMQLCLRAKVSRGTEESFLHAQVTAPQDYTGVVTVTLPGHPGNPALQYKIVRRSLQLQGLGFSICGATFGISL